MSSQPHRDRLARPSKRAGAGWRTLAGTGTGATAALGVLVLITVFVAMGLPRASLNLRTSALQHIFAQLSPTARTMNATIDFQSFVQNSGGGYLPDQLASTGKVLGGQMNSAKVPIDSSLAWTSLNLPGLSTQGAARHAYYGPNSPTFQLTWRDALEHYAKLQSGTWPATMTRQGGTKLFQMAITPATAARFELHVGSRLAIANNVLMTVSGIVRPSAPASAFWSQYPGFASPVFTRPHDSGFWTGGGFVGAAEIPALVAAINPANGQVAWVYPLDLRGVQATDVAALAQHIDAAAGAGDNFFSGAAGTDLGIVVGSGVSSALAGFIATEQAVAGILSLLFVSLAVLGIVVLVLCTQLAADRRNEEFAIMRARGATRWQLGWRALRGGIVTTLPAAVVAILLAIVLTPGGGTTLSWWLAIPTALAGLLGPAILAARRDPASPRARRGAPAARKVASVRRLVAELTLTGLAVAGLIVLRLQGLPANGSVNALASAAPVLAAVPAAIIVVRLCPILLGWLFRAAGRGRGVITFVGLARGAQRAASTLLPVFALVLALAVVTFGGTIRAAVSAGEATAAWELVGADAVVGSPSATISLPPSATRAMMAVRGVQAAAGVIVLPGTSTRYPVGGTQLNVAVVDPRQYAAVLARNPVAQFPAAALDKPPAGSPVPLIASPGAAAALRAAHGIANINGNVLHVVVKAQLTSTPAAPAGSPFIVVPSWAAGGNLPPVMMLFSGPHIDQAALAAVVARTTPGTTVAFRSGMQVSLAAAPLPKATYLAYAEGSAAAAVFSVLVVLISLLLGARTRELVDARLSTMGLSAWQARRVGVVEAIPFILAGAAGGVLALIALVPLIGPALDLSVLTGASGSVRIQPDVPSLVLGSVALVVLAMATLAGQAAAAHRRGIGRSLRVGE